MTQMKLVWLFFVLFFFGAQVVAYLGLKGSFKRKYPDVKRRPVDGAEREFLRHRGIVSDTQADLGKRLIRNGIVQ